jgi:hypothetical protein
MVEFARPAERNRIREQLRIRIDDMDADPVVNRVNIHALADYRSLALGRRTYRVPPITYRVGVQLDSLQLRFQRLRAYNERALAGETEVGGREDEAAYADLHALNADIVRICGPHIWPTYGLARWAHALLRKLHLTRLWPNPLRDQPEPVLLLVLDFFQRCRTNARASDHVRLGRHAQVR